MYAFLLNAGLICGNKLCVGKSRALSTYTSSHAVQIFIAADFTEAYLPIDKHPILALMNIKKFRWLQSAPFECRTLGADCLPELQTFPLGILIADTLMTYFVRDDTLRKSVINTFLVLITFYNRRIRRPYTNKTFMVALEFLSRYILFFSVIRFVISMAWVVFWGALSGT